MNDWIKITKNNLPSINVILLISDGYDVTFGFLDSNHEWDIRESEEIDVLYYMYLPDGPCIQ